MKMKLYVSSVCIVKENNLAGQSGRLSRYARRENVKVTYESNSGVAFFVKDNSLCRYIIGKAQESAESWKSVLYK